MLKDITKGIKNYFTALGVIKKLNLWKFFVIPILISVATGILVISLLYFFYDDIGGFISRFWPWEWGASGAAVVSNVIGGLLIITLGLLLYKHIVMALSAPFMSPVSEKIEAYLVPNGTHKHRETSFNQQLARGVRINIRNLTKELLYMIPLLLLSFIPVIGLIATAMLFLVQAYYAGAGNMDYTMERHLNYKDSIVFTKKNKGIAIGNGLLFILMLFIPVVGFIITLPMAVTAASVATVNRLNDASMN